MSVCRYWKANGQCPYNNSCRFEHTRPFSSSADLIQTLVQTVKQDMEQLERGNQWPFSTYSPVKDCASVPGIDDISPEEMRWDAYQARADGSMLAYQKKYADVTNSYVSKRHHLVNPTQDLLDVFCAIYKRQPLPNSTPFSSSSVANAPSIFGSPSSSSTGGIFASAPTAGSIFGGNNSLFGNRSTSSSQPASLFGGGSSSITQAAPAPSIFANSSASPPSSQSIFSAQSSSSQGGLFGGQSNTGSIFASATPSAGSIFGGQSALSNQAQPQGGIFGGQALSSNSSIFSSGLFSGAESIASAPNVINPFPGSTGESSGLWGQSSLASGYSGDAAPGTAAPSTPDPMSVAMTPVSFAVAQQPPAASSSFESAMPQLPQESSLFGNRQEPAQGMQAKPSAGLFGAKLNQQLDSSTYSPEETLSAEQVAEFQADHFTSGNIPLLPPAEKFCLA